MKTSQIEGLLKQYLSDENIDWSSGKIILPKLTDDFIYGPGQQLTIRISSTIVNNPNTALASNWNSGSYPRTDILDITVEEILGNYIKVSGIGVIADSSYFWEGWLPINAITKINKN